MRRLDSSLPEALDDVKKEGRIVGDGRPEDDKEEDDNRKNDGLSPPLADVEKLEHFGMVGDGNGVHVGLLIGQLGISCQSVHLGLKVFTGDLGLGLGLGLELGLELGLGLGRGLGLGLGLELGLELGLGLGLGMGRVFNDTLGFGLGACGSDHGWIGSRCGLALIREMKWYGCMDRFDL